jgi:RNA polymerase sigma factor (TIGR02999 family)
LARQRVTYNERRMTPRITRLLHEWSSGDEEALNVLMPLVHRELRLLARRHMHHERQQHTLQATALVSEAYLRLLELKQIQWEDREHFFAVAARLMRRILVDAARARDAQKRGLGVDPVPLDEAESKEIEASADLLFVDEALQRLQAFDARKAQVIELRVFMGLSVEEAALVLGVSAETVKRDWRLAKAWLKQELEPAAEADPSPPRSA